MIARFRAAHPFDRFGPANQVTSVRALLVVALAAIAFIEPSAARAWTAAAIASAAALLDGVDGWLARRTRIASAFGARFDMEVDALLILVLSVLAVEYEKAGLWVLASGLLRYLFIAAGAIWPWLRRPLPGTRRGKAICVLQIAGLIVVLIVNPPLSATIAASTLAALAYSFLVDILRLWNSSIPERRWAVLAAALIVLNASLAFDNIWPTPAFWWTGRLSIELAIALLLVAAVRRRRGPFSTRALAALSLVWLLLTLARYVEVTTPALYGRDINLYWDLRFIPDVAAMVVRVAPLWLVTLALLTALAVLAVLHRLLLWALRRVDDAASLPTARALFAIFAGVVIAVFAGERVAGRIPEERFTPSPVSYTYAHQVSLVVEARNGSKSLPPSPAIDSTFDQVRGADVFLVFVESYGAITDEPAFASRLAAARQQLEADILQTSRRVVSAYVESPTFGGSSWLAHLSLISGIEVKDPDTNALLMTQPRDTLVKAFARAGFRTIGLMPGLRQQWPEGRFYGFSEIYGADRLAYTGPEFGWFAIPDQFALARFDALEASKPQQPRFVFFPTISTHFPFTPTPPYQPDWPRMLTGRPYDGPAIVRAYKAEPDWTDFSPGYVAAMAYDFAVLGGYLRVHANRDLVMILIGDHQPPAAVSGEHASWNVPVHVITSRRSIVDRLVKDGFREGLQPERNAITRMHALQPVLLGAF